MIYTLLSILCVTVLLTLTTSYMILSATIAERPLRRVLLFFIFLTPFAAFFALVKTLFRQPKPVRYNSEFASVEDDIERERVTLFGGKPMHPSFAHRWQKSYIAALEKSAAATVKRIAPALDPSLSPITHR